jgi:hypothetical protein
MRSDKNQGSLVEGEGSTVDLRVLTSLDQLLLIPKISFTILTKQATFTRTEPSPQLVFPAKK